MRKVEVHCISEITFAVVPTEFELNSCVLEATRVSCWRTALITCCPEDREINEKVFTLLAVMFLFFLAGLGFIIVSGN